MGGDINVYATDDGVNAANKDAQQSDIYFTMTGGNLTVPGSGQGTQTQSTQTAISLSQVEPLN